MNFSPESAISIENILSDVIAEVNDDDYKMFPPGHYVHLIQRALEELSFDSFFSVHFKDFDFPASTLSLTMPKGAFNLKQVYLFNEDDTGCSVDSMQRVYYKRTYYTKGEGFGYTANNKNGVDDEFIIDYSPSERTFFFSIQNGKITFGSACSSYGKVRLVYNGVLTNIGEVPVVPLPFRSVVIDYVVENIYRKLKNKDPRKYRILWADIHQTLYKPITGTWDKAVKRGRKLDSKVREDYMEYFSKMNY